MFIHKFYHHLQANNCGTQLTKLNEEKATANEVEKLDTLIGQAGDTAEKHCRRRRPEFYSQDLNAHRIKTSIALGHLNNIRLNRETNTASFDARLQRAGIEMILPPTRKEAYDLYTTLKQNLHVKIKTSSELREQSLQELINKKVTVGTANHSRKVKAIRTKEAAKKAWKTLKFLKAQSGATQTLNRIDIPNSWPGISDPIPPYSDLEDPKKCTNWRNIIN